MNYHDLAADLRQLADLLDDTAIDLPLPMFPNTPIRLHIDLFAVTDVEQAAAALGTAVEIRADGGQVVTETRIDTVRLEFAYVSDEWMAQ